MFQLGSVYWSYEGEHRVSGTVRKCIKLDETINFTVVVIIIIIVNCHSLAFILVK